MRALFLVSLSAVLLSACLTTQENPNYEHSTVYRGETASTTQYASTAPVQSTLQTTSASYETVAAPSYPVYAHSYPTEAIAPVYQAPVQITSTSTEAISSVPVTSELATSASVISAPTDTAYASQEVTGTPGFMAMQNAEQVEQDVSYAEAAPALPAAEVVTYSPLRAAGTPVVYDHSRNIVTADAMTTGQELPETVRVLQGPDQNYSDQNYTVMPGDTVYSLSRKTCVGVNVIQSMNGLESDYGINIGQSLRLPASVC